MKTLIPFILMILALLFFLFRKDGQARDANSRTKELDNLIIQREALIGSLSDEILQLQNIASKARIDTVYKHLPSKKQKAATLPPMQRDSMFNATTDTVDILRSTEPPLMVEPYRIAASNVLFTELGETLKIVRFQENVIDTLEINISKQETRFDASEERADALEEQKDIAESDASKLEKRNWFLKYVVAPVIFVVGLLVG